MISQPRPWEAKTISYGLKLLSICGFVLALISAFGSLFIAIGVLGSLARGTARSSGSAIGDLLPLAGALAVFVVSAALVVLLAPLLRRPTSFRPRYGAVPAAATGQPFEVRFHKPLFARSFRGKGTLRFEAEQLVLDGMLEPNAGLQIGVVLVLTLLPLVIFRVGLGIIPALLIGGLIGRKQLALPVAYAQVRDLSLHGCQVTFRREGAAPNTLIVQVAPSDGERLYRELGSRFPAQAGGWGYTQSE